MPEIEANKQGRNILIAFKKDIGKVLLKGSEYDDGIILTKAATILRKLMLDTNSSFTGSFEQSYVDQSVPLQLLQFVAQISHGSDIISQSDIGLSKANVALAQLLQFNCHQDYKKDAAYHRHTKDREPPFPVYIAMSIYSKTRSRELMETLYDHGICISYDRLLQISNQLGEKVLRIMLNMVWYVLLF